MEKDKSVVKRKQKNQPKRKMRTNHLLIIGIDQYANGIAKLNNAVRDAQQFKDLVIKQFQFDKKNITELYNQDATRGNILQVFSRLMDELTDKDNLVFYYSGHGEQIEKGKGKLGYWIPSDATYKVDWSYISNANIINLFKLSKAHHIFGIVDSCFSGSLFATRKANTAAERIDSFPSRWLLTAGRLEVVSDGSLGNNSPFAEALLTYLKNSPDDAIWVSDLCNQVIKGMKFNTTKQFPRGEALQDVGHYGGQFVFYKKGYEPTEAEEIIAKPSLPKVPLPTKGIDKNASKSAPTPTTLPELKAYLKEILMEDLGKAVTTCKKYLNRESKSYNDFIMQAGQYNRVNNQLIEGTIAETNANITLNKVRLALLGYIDELTEEDVLI